MRGEAGVGEDAQEAENVQKVECHGPSKNDFFRLLVWDLALMALKEKWEPDPKKPLLPPKDRAERVERMANTNPRQPNTRCD